jgi:predicted HTH transcriptional regulator
LKIPGDEQRRLDRIGEILAGGVALWLKSRECVSLQQPVDEEDHLTDNTTISPELDQILKLIQQFGEISTSDVMLHLELTRSTARRRLSELVSIGRIRPIGKGRGARYILLR